MCNTTYFFTLSSPVTSSTILNASRPGTSNVVQWTCLLRPMSPLRPTLMPIHLCGGIVPMYLKENWIFWLERSCSVAHGKIVWSKLDDQLIWCCFLAPQIVRRHVYLYPNARSARVLCCSGSLKRSAVVG